MSSIGARLLEVADSGKGRLVFHMADGEMALSTTDLAKLASRAAAVLAAEGVRPGDRVGLLGRNRPEWAVWAFGTWLAGAALVPLQVPVRIFDQNALTERTRSVIAAAGCSKVVVAPELRAFVPEGLALDLGMPVRDVAAALPVVSPEWTALIQYTSGSTAEPRGVVITHAAVLAWMSSHVQGSYADPAEDRALGWVPFFHDLGLFYFLVLAVLEMDASHILPTERFAADPSEWLRLVSEVGATLLVAPPSGWSAALAAATRRGTEPDLSTITSAWFGAEPLDPAFLDDFLRVAPQLQLSKKAVGNSYGLAEAVLAVAVTPLGTGLRVFAYDQAVMSARGEAVPATGNSARIVSCGKVLPGLQVRVVDEHDSPVPDRIVGHLQIGGPSLMVGYLNRDPLEGFAGGWLRTGDLGFVDQDELFVTGRVKDMLIVHGHNYFPDDFEWAAGRVPGVRPGRCVAFTVENGTRIVLLVEPRDAQDAASLRRQVSQAVADAVGTSADVQLVEHGTIEKTTSGKLRRHVMRQRFEDGTIPTL